MFVVLSSPYCQCWVLEDNDPYLQDHPSMYSLESTHDSKEEAEKTCKELNESYEFYMNNNGL